MMYGDEETLQGEMLLDAIERSGRPRKVVAAELGVAYQTLDGWIRGQARFPLVQLGRLTAVLGPWLLNHLLEPHGFKVVRLYAKEKEDDLFESLRDAALRLGGSTGRVTAGVADATDPASAGGKTITPQEAAEIRDRISEAEAYLQHMKEQLSAATGAN